MSPQTSHSLGGNPALPREANHAGYRQLALIHHLSLDDTDVKGSFCAAAFDTVTAPASHSSASRCLHQQTPRLSASLP
jgi:hypothetical protein